MKNEVKIEEAATPDSTVKTGGFEIAKTAELTGVTGSIGQVKDELLHDKPIKVGLFDEVRNSLDRMKVNIGGEEFTLDQVKNDPQVRLWKSIQMGEDVEINQITLITPKLAKLLVEKKANALYLQLSGLTSLTKDVAEILAMSGSSLFLDGLKEISLETARSLAETTANLYLDKLVDISPEVADLLGKGKSNSLSLNGLTHLDPKIAALLCQHANLNLKGLESLNKELASIFAKHEGFLHLEGVSSVSFQEALKLRKTRGKIRLRMKNATSLASAAALQLLNNNPDIILID